MFLYGAAFHLLIIGACHGQAPNFTLLNGNKMPAIGFGTYLLTDEKELDTAITTALETGYRSIDTAYFYKTEKTIGKVLKKWFAKGGSREDLFITTKLPISAMRASDVAKVLDLSLSNLGLEYVDMYLIHGPLGMYPTPDFDDLVYDNGTVAFDYTTDHIAIWKELEKQVKLGKAKSIGLSNFNKTQVLRIWENSEIKPSNLQIELNPYIQQNELVDFCHDLGIVVTAYSPLGSGAIPNEKGMLIREGITLPPVLQHDVLKAIAKKHNKSPAQVSLRFGFQRNLVVIPKTSHPERVHENFEIFDFVLTDSEMKQLKALDRHGTYRKFYFTDILPGSTSHPEYPFAEKVPNK